MRAERNARQAALGFSVHTGWAALVAITAEPRGVVVILDRRRVEMIPGHDPDAPPFVYHAARGRSLAAAETFIRAHEAESVARAKPALRAAIGALEAQGVSVVASGIPVGDRPLVASLAAILASHALIHTAEGELYRGAIRDASRALGLPVTEVRAKELPARAATSLGIAPGALESTLAAIGRAAGRPWAKDHKQACLAAAVALRGAPPFDKEISP